MELSMWYWLFVVLWVIFGGYNGYRNANGQWIWAGPWILELILFVIIGLRLFGPLVKGG